MSTNAEKWENLIQFPIQMNHKQFASDEQEETLRLSNKSLEQLIGIK